MSLGSMLTIKRLCYLRPCKPDPPCEFHSIKLYFLHGMKGYWPYILYVDKAKTHSLQDLFKIGAYNLIFWVKIIFENKNNKTYIIFFAKVNSGLSTLTHQKLASCIVWQLIYMLWAAVGFGFIRMVFEFGFSLNRPSGPIQSISLFVRL